MTRWWQQWPGRLEYELEELKDAGISFEQDGDALRAGIVRLRLIYTVEDQEIPLVVTYPELYPYFRPEIQAPAAQYEYHQNPNWKNLCLLGRATDNWEQNFTVYWLLKEQLPKLLAAVRGDPDVVTDGEERQAEPFGNYYPCDRQSNILLDSGMVLEKSEVTGWMTIGTMQHPPFAAGTFLQGAVLDVSGNNGLLLARADQALRDTYRGPKLKGRWRRVERPISDFDPVSFFATAEVEDPGAHGYSGQGFGAGIIRIFGVIFPEEHRWREGGTRDGWVFVTRYDQHVSVVPSFVQQQMSPRPQGQRQSYRGKQRP
jgi:hypothetical protein